MGMLLIGPHREWCLTTEVKWIFTKKQHDIFTENIGQTQNYFFPGTVWN